MCLIDFWIVFKQIGNCVGLPGKFVQSVEELGEGFPLDALCLLVIKSVNGGRA